MSAVMFTNAISTEPSFLFFLDDIFSPCVWMTFHSAHTNSNNKVVVETHYVYYTYLIW